MSGFHSNPQALYQDPAAHDPLRTQAYYQVNPVPYAVTEERAAANMDRLMPIGPYGNWIIPPSEAEERAELDAARGPDETLMENFAKVQRQKAKDMDASAEADWEGRHERDTMRQNPDMYEEYEPGKFRVNPNTQGAFDIFNYFGDGGGGDNPRNPNQAAAFPELIPSDVLDQLEYEINGEWNVDMLVKDGVFLLAIGFGVFGYGSLGFSKKFWPYYYTALGMWRYLSFYRVVDPKASVAAAAYWGTGYYLWGPRYMGGTFLLDLIAARLYIRAEQEKKLRGYQVP